MFSVQATIAQEVTRALGVTLAPTERTALERAPTGNLSAYDAYLRGSVAAPPDFTIGAERIVSRLQGIYGTTPREPVCEETHSRTSTAHRRSNRPANLSLSDRCYPRARRTAVASERTP